MRKAGARLRIGTVAAIVVIIVAGASPAYAGPIIGYKWNSIGPQPSCCFFPGGETGRATSIAVNPADVNDIWVGTAGGGVWHSSSGGTLWLPMSDTQASLAIGSLALAGCNAATGCAWVYAGTGEDAIRRDTYYGAGLLVGSNGPGGLTWTLRDGTPTYDFTHGTIYNVVLDPTTSGAGQVIYITLSSGVTASASESTVTAPEPYPGGYGIYKSSDNGATWTKLVVPGSGTNGANGRPTDLEMERADPSVLYAGFLGRGIFRSTDAGASWCPLDSGIPKPAGCPATTGLPRPSPNGFDHVEVAIDRGDASHLYATFGNCPDRLVTDCEPSVYESTDAGLDWTMRYAGSRTGTPQNQDLVCPRGYTRYTHGLTISPTDPATLYISGYHLCESNSHGQSWYAIDGNNNAGSNIYGSMLHPDHHELLVHETDFTHLYDVNDGGVAISTDGGFSWTPKTGGLDAFEFQSLAASPDTTDVFGGAQDNAGVRWTGTKTWQHLDCCGDGGFAAYETYNVGGLYDRIDMYITSNFGGAGNFTTLPVRSLDGGNHWPSPGLPPASYDLGLDPAEPQSFYPPLTLGGGYEIFASNRLYTSVSELYSFTPRSPVLSSDPESEITAGADVITAVAVAPSLSNRFYLGYYSGKVFESDAPCSTLSCWTQVASPSPGAPVTWLAVDPGDPDVVYATVSGFGPGVHVFKTTTAGTSWSPTGSLAELNGVPANTIAVDPTDASHLLLGTDHGIYGSTTFGGSWYRYSPGLPNVPVYALVYDATHGRTFAATHGRGAYTLGPILSKTYVEGPIHKLVLDQPVFGSGYRANQRCTVKVILQDGRVCASGSTDALGGTIGTDADGVLVSSRPGFFTDLPVVWACTNGACLGGDASACQEDGNPIGSVEVGCGGSTSIDTRPPSPNTPDPGSTLFSIGGTGGFPASGAFRFVPAVQIHPGPSQRLCSVLVPFSFGDTQGTLLQKTADAVNGDAGCMAAGVAAVVDPPVATGAPEDSFPRAGRLSLSAPGITGGALVASFDAAPGQATGVCFSASGLDDPVRGQIRSMKVRFTTPPVGATGGTITLTERSPLGTCRIPVAIPAGTMPSGIAAAIAAAFQAPGDPSPYPDCPTGENPRDVVARGDSVRAALASELIVCSTDPAVGTGTQPTEICSTDADCDDGNPCTADSCDPATGECASTAVPDGQTCDDGNACTVGNVCMSGVCGTPVVCNDGNPCTTDRCDPATGACTSTAIVCDDGNPCTSDACTAAGGCTFTPNAGAACSTGDLCTVGGTCVTSPGNPIPTCQGTPKCQDADPCTADSCDPATGTCSNPPIVCDDGNPCTIDSCQGGTCVSVAVGGACDDGNRCTVADTCVPGTSGTTCQGQPVSCDDGNACTADACDPVTGGCLHTAVPIADVAGLAFTSETTMTWPAVAGASLYDTYRGTIPAGGLGSRSPAGPVYDQTCFEHGDALGDGTLVTTDAGIPPAGTAFYYLVSEATPCGEGPIGEDSNGTSIPNTSPCPSP